MYAVSIDVMSRSSLDLRVETLGRELVVEGSVRDDLGRGIGYRRVRIVGENTRSEEDGLQGSFSAEATTNSAGYFRFTRLVPAGEWHVQGQFVGDIYTGSDDQEESVSVRERSPRVLIVAPAVVPVSEATVPVEVQVFVGGTPAAGTPITFESDCGQIPEGAVVGADGVAHAEFRFTRDAVGPCSVRAHAEGQSRFRDGEAYAAMRRFDEPTIRVRAEFVRGQPFFDGSWSVFVEVFDRYGGLEGGTIELSGSGDLLATSLVSENAVARFDVPESSLGDRSSIVATFIPDAGELRLSSEPLLLERPPSPSGIFGAISIAVAILLALVILAAVVREMRRSRPKSTVVKPTAAGVSTEPEVEVVAGSILVVVRDAEDSKPIEATIHVGDSDATFQSAASGVVVIPSPKGFSFHAVAPGYLPHRGAISHPGKGRRAVIRLKSVRAEVRDILREVLSGIGGEQGNWWGKISVRSVTRKTLAEVRTLRREPLRASTHRRELYRLIETAQRTAADAEALEALTLLVDDVYFGGGGELETVEVARALADATRGLQ
ncbi:MAG: hypothetical protein ACJAYU_005465 [Bradymonadia bacterium]